MHSYYSHGKLLITAEYFVLDGAKALALPSKMGQSLTVKENLSEGISWKSFTSEGHLWFETIFKENLKTTNDSKTAYTLQNILKEAQKLNPNFLKNHSNLAIETHLEFPENWGLGSSSTLINNIAQWAQVNAFTLLENSFGGSGYDIAAAQNNTPITYQKTSNDPIVTPITLEWNFTHELFFVHLNRKQDSKEGIKRYRNESPSKALQNEVSQLTHQIIVCQNKTEFESLLETHEHLISKFLDIPTVKDTFFNDYPGAIKSLGAWGGDFILVVGDQTDHAYFKNKGFNTILEFHEMIV